MLCVLAQLGLGASSALGLVVCVGRDHAAVESPADHCCSRHGTAELAFESSCCDDLPLVSVWRSAVDLRRDETSPTIATTLTSSIPVCSAVVSAAARAVILGPPPTSPLASRATVLRV